MIRTFQLIRQHGFSCLPRIRVFYFRKIDASKPYTSACNHISNLLLQAKLKSDVEKNSQVEPISVSVGVDVENSVAMHG